MLSKELIEKSFQEQFNHLPFIIAKSPGRINLIGEHTDYNNGFVMPAAIDKYIYVAVSKREDDSISAYSEDYKTSLIAEFNVNVSEIPDWAKYIIGVAEIINQKTNKVKGFNIYVLGDVPLGAGLSSSAAFSCATAFALNKLFDCNLSREDIAKVGQQTEHQYIGVKCGIMDQFASVMGKENHAIQLDCKDLTFNYAPLDFKDYEILLFNTNVKHNLASSAYNERREACEQGVAWIKEFTPQVESLRDVTLDDLNTYVLPKSKEVFTKCKFVVEENLRVEKATQALKNNQIDELGKLLFEAHWALSKEYEVSCPELDFLIDEVSKIKEVVGARMMGGGFGGCTINLVKKGERENVINQIVPLYQVKFGISPTSLRVSIGNGTSLMD